VAQRAGHGSHAPAISVHANHRRPDAATAACRNRREAALADVVFIVYAAPRGKTEALCREAVDWGKPVYTLDGPHNAHLMAAGALAMTVGTDAHRIAQVRNG
jgi:predicted Rossmann fold nucleotide-binding protein DprA/Smf involved in DNA uptake